MASGRLDNNGSVLSSGEFRGLGRYCVVATVAAFVAACGTSAEGEDEPAVTEVGSPIAAASPSPTEQAAPEYGLRVDDTLTVREGPGTQFDPIGTLNGADLVIVACSTEGEPVTDPDGVLVARWDRISAPVSGYIAGAFVDTDGKDPAVEACQFVPTAPEEPQDAGELFETVSDGVVRIETTTCDGGGVGSGFLIAPDLVATVAHVVEGSASITLRAGDEYTSGEVIGMDPTREVALVRAGQPFAGYVFSLAEGRTSVGQDVVAVGYPNGDPISLTRGAVSAVGRTIDTGEEVLTDLIQTDAAVNPGNSGGPLMTLDGSVLGLVDLLRTDSQGIAYAVSAPTAKPLLEEWAANPQVVRTDADCATPFGSPDGYVDVEIISEHPEASAVAEMMRIWADGINVGDYQSSWDMYSQRHRDTQSFAEFADGNTTSYVLELFIWSIDGAGDAGAITANVGFVSVQDPQYGRNGQACSVWDLNYDLVWERGSWRIDSAALYEGREPQPC